MLKQTVYKPTRPYKKEYDTPIEQQKEFAQNWLEWVSKKREIISPAGVFDGQGITNIFTVPEGFHFFLTNASISMTCDGAGAPPGALAVSLVGLANSNKMIGIIAVRDDKVINLSINPTFLKPFKIPPGSIVQLVNDSFRLCSAATISGWLEPNATS